MGRLDTFDINSLSPERKKSFIDAKNAFISRMQDALELLWYPPFCLEQNSEESQNYRNAVNDYCKTINSEDFLENPVRFDFKQFETGTTG